MGELAVLFCFAFLYIASRGGGPASLDAHDARLEEAPTDLLHRARGQPAADRLHAGAQLVVAQVWGRPDAQNVAARIDEHRFRAQ